MIYRKIVSNPVLRMFFFGGIISIVFVFPALAQSPFAAWDFPIDTQGWGSANQISGFGWQSGTYVGGAIAGTDPYFLSSYGLNVPISSSRAIIKIVMRNSSPAIAAAIFFDTNNDPYWDALKSKSFPITPNSGFLEYTINMSANGNWVGKIGRASCRERV